MIIIKSVHDVPIRLTSERWLHIVARHPEMEKQKDRILETVIKPDLVQQGDFKERMAIKHFENALLTSKYLLVIYQIEGFIFTAYFTNMPSERRKMTWKLCLYLCFFILSSAL